MASVSNSFIRSSNRFGHLVAPTRRQLVRQPLTIIPHLTYSLISLAASAGAVVQPLPTAYLIFRAPSQAAGKCWMDALELSLRCSALLLRSNSSTTSPSTYAGEPLPVSHETQWSEADYEKHFNDHGKWMQQWLAPPSAAAEQDASRSDNSQSSRAQTPLLQQLYSSAVNNWERTKRLPRFGGRSERSRRGSNASSSDFHSALKQLSPFSKSFSLGGGGTLCNSSSSDDEDMPYGNVSAAGVPGSRPVSAPPGCLLRPRFQINVKGEGETLCILYPYYLHT